MRRPRILPLLRDLYHIHRFASAPMGSWVSSPAGRRKSRARRFLDLLAWRLREGEVNKFYYLWGLDREGAPELGSLLSLREFVRLRDRNNLRPVGDTHVDYRRLLADKFQFAQYVQAMGHPAPSIVALAEHESITWIEPRRTEPLASILEMAQPVDMFCKEAMGQQGQGTFHLRIADGVIRINGEKSDLEDLTARLSTRTILQQRVVQHPALGALYPHSVNTLRVLTVRLGGAVQPFSFPTLRCGVSGNVVDNWSAGGLIVPVDPSSGVLQGPGRLLSGGILTHHPDTAVAFDGFELPYYASAIELALRLHHDFPGLHSVGWDLAFTPDGPVVLEGNSRWSGALRIAFDPNFKREFVRLFSAA